jgi:hypothetical protein
MVTTHDLHVDNLEVFAHAAHHVVNDANKKGDPIGSPFNFKTSLVQDRSYS